MEMPIGTRIAQREVEMRHIGEWIVDSLTIPQEYLRVGVLVSLLSVMVLVVLFFYLNHYTKRRYFAIWNVAWLFYAVWLALGLSLHNPDATPLLGMLRQWCLNCATVFLLWGSACFLGGAVGQRLVALGAVFLCTWSYAGFFESQDSFWAGVAGFALLGIASMAAASAFWKMRCRGGLVGASLISLGFGFWGIYLAAYPWLAGDRQLLVAAFFISAVLQLIIAVSMIVLVLEEVQFTGQQERAEAQKAMVEQEGMVTRVSFAEERYRALFQQAHDGILLVSSMDLRIMDWNPAAQQLLGVDVKNDEPRYIGDFINLPDSGKGADWLDVIRQSPLATLRRADGKSVAVTLDASAIDLAGSKTYHLVVRELTEEVRLQNQLREAERLSALGQLASGIAHEVNNPLAIMAAHLELILARQACDSRTEADLRKVLKENDRAASLIKNFLVVARDHQQAERQPLDLNRIISDVAESQQLPKSGRPIRCTVQLDAHCPPIFGDASELERVIINLFQNARQATAKNSDMPHIKLVTRRKGELVQARVEDNGPGVPEELVSKIFEPFFTTKDVGAGTGLGLSISRQIIIEHHGRIFYERSLLGGAAFVLEFPLVNMPGMETPPAKPEPPAPEVAPAPTHRPGARILMIDDEEALAEMVCEFLSMSGHRAQFCGSAEKALDLMEKSEFDLIISDFRMPGLTGEQLYERTLRQNPDLAKRIVFMTGDIIGADAKRFFSTHEVPCLTKPCALPTIERFINTHLGQLLNVQ
jgi:PAS domain S-box-containing protein